MAHLPSSYTLDAARAAIGTAIFKALQPLRHEGVPSTLDPLVIGRLLEQPPERDFGDFALPCFRFAKELRRKPPEIAELLKNQLHAQLQAQGWIVKVEVVGAFLNIYANLTLLAQDCIPAMLDGTYFDRLKAATSPEKVSPETPSRSRHQTKTMIEFSQPNTLKEFHVGHTRNVCLGDSLVRIFRYCGYPVTGANYYGDDGTHIALVLWNIQKNQLVIPASKQDEWFGQVYSQARKALDESPEPLRTQSQKEISDIHRSVETRQGPYYKLWQETRELSLAAFAKIYAWLGVTFDVEFYESEMTEAAQKIVEEFYAKGIFVLDQGAIGSDLKDSKLGFCILRKTDGNTLYATKDLALARRKFEEYQIDRNIYVVADEQNYHFKQVFKTLEQMGFKQASQCYHLSYGLVMLPDGKMSSRAGTAVTLPSLRRQMEEALGQILAKYQGEWSQEELVEATRLLCVGAMKYGMVSTDPVKEIIFNLDDWLSFEGHSGPYLMYSYSRTQSMIRKAAELGHRADPSHFQDLKEASERDLVRHLYDFNEVVAYACEAYKPSILAQHLFSLCKSFNRFYSDVPVLKAGSESLIKTRLALIEAVSIALFRGLDLLGIVPPKRM